MAAIGIEDRLSELPRMNSSSATTVETPPPQNTAAGSGSREEMLRFVGPRAAAYVGGFPHSPPQDKTTNLTGSRTRRGQWHWPAFLWTVPWMFYRKMYSGGIILIVLPVFLDHILPGALFLGSGLLIAVACGLFAKTWYVEHAARRIAKAYREFEDPRTRQAYIDHAGGVSVAGAVFGLLTQIATISVIILDIMPLERL